MRELLPGIVIIRWIVTLAIKSILPNQERFQVYSLRAPDGKFYCFTTYKVAQEIRPVLRSNYWSQLLDQMTPRHYRTIITLSIEIIERVLLNFIVKDCIFLFLVDIFFLFLYHENDLLLFCRKNV